jgi:toxin-antitoxin system PIN domain toxin
VILPDVNILVYAHRTESRDHEAYREWLESLVNGDQAYGMFDDVVGGFVRIVTHPRIYRQPSSIDEALTFAAYLREQPNSVPIRPGPRHWEIFARLCRKSGARGNLVPDAYLAALAIESGCELVTNDADFARFKGLSWRHPFA